MSIALISLAGGAWIFLAFLIVMLFAVTTSLYSRRGSGISQRPYGNVYGGAPGAHGPSVIDHDHVAARGYRGVRP
ncbi:MAG TPA: hypothetical protein VGY97_04630 [Solirubrobacteraceae bacterium]|jgi:hypothetical protein|nr:hypothetical protein [Solirubrobacteraceae bacterium]